MVLTMEMEVEVRDVGVLGLGAAVGEVLGLDAGAEVLRLEVGWLVLRLEVGWLVLRLEVGWLVLRLAVELLTPASVLVTLTVVVRVPGMKKTLLGEVLELGRLVTMVGVDVLVDTGAGTTVVV
jgi:hypothetical protein